jgi:hypothetical protein
MATRDGNAQFNRQWRFCKTATGGEVVQKELNDLEADDAAALVAEMRVVARRGLRDGGARHLRGGKTDPA